MSEEIKEEHIKRYIKICKNMQSLLNEIKEYCPGVNIYVEGDSNWHLMTGDSHEHTGPFNEEMRQDRSAVSVVVKPSGGGGW